MSKIVKRIVTAVLAAVGLIVFAVGGYVIYLFVDYERIQDNLELAINNNMTSEIMLGTEYTIMTYNLGFGAYDREFSFFMDVGDSKAGERRVGKSGKARSKEADLQNINGALDTIVKKTRILYLRKKRTLIPIEVITLTNWICLGKKPPAMRTCLRITFVRHICFTHSPILTERAIPA